MDYFDLTNSYKILSDIQKTCKFLIISLQVTGYFALESIYSKSTK